MSGILTVISYLINTVLGVGLFSLPSAIKSYYGILVFIVTSGVFVYIGTVFSSVDYIELIERYSNKFTFFILMWTIWIASWASNVVLIKNIVSIKSMVFAGDSIFTKDASLYIFLVGIFCLFNYFSAKNEILRKILAFIKFLSVFLFIYAAFMLPYNGSMQTGNVVFSHFANSVWCFVGIENTYLMLKNLNTSKSNIYVGLLFGISLLSVIYLVAIIVVNKTIVQVNEHYFAYLSQKLFNTNMVGILLPFLINVLSLYTWMADGATFAEEMASSNIFPAILGNKNKYGVAYIGLILTSVLLIFIMLFVNKICSNLIEVIDSFASIFLLFYAYIMGIYAYDKKSIASAIITMFFLYLFFNSGGLWINVLLFISGIPVFLLKEYSII